MSSSHEWHCGKCGKATRDTHMVAEGFMTDLCVSCRGFVTCTPDQARVEIAEREAKWNAHVAEFHSRTDWRRRWQIRLLRWLKVLDS